MGELLKKPNDINERDEEEEEEEENKHHHRETQWESERGVGGGGGGGVGGGGGGGALQGDSSRSQATFKQQKQQQQQRGSSLATMAMRKRGYMVPFTEDDSFNLKYLQGEEYSKLCSFYGVNPVRPGEVKEDSESKDHDDDDDGEVDEVHHAPGDERERGLPNKKMLRRALTMIQELINNNLMDDLQEITVAVLRCTEGLASEESVGSDRGQDDAVTRQVLINIDGAVKYSLKLEKRMMNEVLEDVMGGGGGCRKIGLDQENDDDDDDDDDETSVRRVQHGLEVGITLLCAVGTVNERKHGARLPSQITDVQEFIDNVLEMSNRVRDSIVRESDLLEMLQQDDFISPTISTLDQLQLYMECVETVNLSQKDLEERQRLSNKISRLSRRIERHHDMLWLWSDTVMRVVKQVSDFYVKTESLLPAELMSGYNWILGNALESNNIPIFHFGIKKIWCQSVISMMNRSIRAQSSPPVSPRNNMDNNDNNPPGSTSDDFFVDVPTTSMSSPLMLSACNDLLLVLLKKIDNKGQEFRESIPPQELNMMVRACIVHKEHPPRTRCVRAVLKLWRHPNSSVRHAALKGFDMLCKSNIPEIMKLVGGSQSGSDSSLKEPSTLVVQVNQRLQERDCDDEDRQLLNVLLSWFYSLAE
jgi:hypothetical protein